MRVHHPGHEGYKAPWHEVESRDCTACDDCQKCSEELDVLHRCEGCEYALCDECSDRDLIVEDDESGCWWCPKCAPEAFTVADCKAGA